MVEQIPSSFKECKQVRFEEDGQGFAYVQLVHGSGISDAKIYLFGGNIVSWKVDGAEVLAMRGDFDLSSMDGTKPISGGIPHCFPQFGPGEMQQHGFARNMMWTVCDAKDTCKTRGDSPSVTIKLLPTDYSREMWNHKFEVLYKVTLMEADLHTSLLVINQQGSGEFSFSTALHSYFAVSNIANVEIEGLGREGQKYLDKVEDAKNPPEKLAEEGALGLTSFTDRIYLDAPPVLRVVDKEHGSALKLSSTNWPEAVVWNPFQEKMESETFVCVENAVVRQPVTLLPGQSWRAEMSLTRGKL